MIQITCPVCRKTCLKRTGDVNRSTKNGKVVYCSRKCSVTPRLRSEEHKRETRRRLQKKYREEKGAERAVYAKAYYWKSRDERLSAAKLWYAEHKEHVSRRGRLWRARRFFGVYAEAYLIWLELDREIARRVPDKYERLKARGCYARYNENKKERRRRERGFR